MQLRRSFCLWFTGLSGAGKSTASTQVHELLQTAGITNIERLDGDVVRTHLTKGLGFDREDRDTNVLRIGWVCQLLTKHNVPVITAAISPYIKTRTQVRHMVEEVAGAGTFIEVFVNANVDTCSKRDVKGLYARAQAGEIANFTGVSDPYEAPESPELELYTADETLEQSAAKVLDYLIVHKFIEK
ncbi:MAG: adenylyl-sulfate kinase [Mariprofundales bacterium]